MDWDDAYNNSDHIADAAGFPPRWARLAEAFRQRMTAAGRARLDIAYGDGARERFDLFLPDGGAQGLVVFVHGGYWRAFGKSDWSHLADGTLQRGWAVASRVPPSSVFMSHPSVFFRLLSLFGNPAAN